ncbi:MAG: hypothetical protein A2275_16955, partial [Bacteroidetes bacterium RIFOXYA12_FULL_35_11]
PIDIYNWDFGDGNISSEFAPAHIYQFAGIFNVSLMVSDTNGCIKSTEFENYIITYKPVCYFTSNLTSSCNGKLISSFTNLSTGSGLLTYFWDFGDGLFSIEEEPVHTYQSPGIFTVKLITTDSHGCLDTLIRYDYIKITKTQAVFSANIDTICKNDSIQFVNNSLNSNQYEWNFGDGFFSDEISPLHVFTTSGEYNVILMVSKNGQCYDSASININIENIIADFNVAENFGCELPFNAQYLDNSTNAVSWEWHFGFRNHSFVQNPAYTIYYDTTGNYQMIFSDTLIVTSLHGCIDTAIVDSSIVIILPKLDFLPSMDGPYGCIPVTLNYTNQSTYNTNLDHFESWIWDYGNGNTSQNWDGLYTYNNSGSFLVTFTAVTQKGCSVSKFTNASAGTPQIPDFTVNAPDSLCASDTVSFLNLSSDQNLINYYFWSFSDGYFSWDKNPSCTFHDTGYVSVSLLTSYNGCNTQINKANLFYVKGPVASQGLQYECEHPLDYTFIANVKETESYYWNFGDGSPIVMNTTPCLHSFNSSGNYQILLSADNSVTGCSYESMQPIQVREIIADFTMTDSVGCPGDEILFDGSVSQDEAYDNFQNLYNWYFDDTGENIFTSLPDGLLNHQFNTKGTHSVKLQVQDINGCIGVKNKKIKIYQPQTEFSASYQTGCLPIEFIFFDNTISDTTITDYLWNFGDSALSTDINPVHEYQNFGAYDVSLSVINVLGCTNNLVKQDFIKALSPDPHFYAFDSTLCMGDSLILNNESESEIVNYFWSFGDGNTSANEAPWHVFADTGIYTVSLTIIDDHGCDSTKIISNYISIQEAPQADFISDIFSAECYPALIHFTDLSESNHTGSWIWLFGDNQTASELQNPSHTYFKPGVYDVTLIASSTNGCTDTIIKNNYVTIKGPWAMLNAPDTICRGDTAILFASDKINVYFQKWDLGNGITSNDDTTKTSYFNYGPAYPSLLLFSDSSHTCNKLITDTILVFDVISNFSINDGNYDGCVPLDFNLSDISANANAVSWYINNFLVSQTSDYSGILTNPGNHDVSQVIFNDFGCSDTSQKTLIVFPLPTVNIVADTLICRDNTVRLFASGGIYFHWWPDQFISNTEIFNPVVNPDSSMLYFVSVTDTNSCRKDTFVSVEVFQVPQITMSDTSVIIGETVNLNVYNSEILYYNWVAENSLSCLDCYNPVAIPLEPTMYSVFVTDLYHCFTQNYFVFIDVMKKYSVDVPELFTPNGDGKNDHVFVRGWGIKELMEFRIFNRFGEMVFESKELTAGWDGSYKREPQNIETFTYVVRVLTHNNDILTKKGFIKLIR